MPDRGQGAGTTKADASRKHLVIFEGIAMVLLSLATVGTAWCSFQSASWAGVSQRLTNQSTMASRRAMTAELKANQTALLDVLLFSQYVNARAASNAHLAEFYAERFRGEAKMAFQSWMATMPFEHTNAPAHPFIPALYHPRLLTDASQAEEEAEGLRLQAGDAGRASRGYVLITVVLASALFCGGTAAKFENLWVRRSVLFMGLAAFAFACIRLLELPIQN